MFKIERVNVENYTKKPYMLYGAIGLFLYTKNAIHTIFKVRITSKIPLE
jgi:hypothetical protein